MILVELTGGMSAITCDRNYAEAAFLFSLDPGLVEDLDNHLMFSGLRGAFQNQNKPLTPQAQVGVIQSHIAWTIIDGGTTYTIQNENATLNVYGAGGLINIQPAIYLFSLALSFAGDLDGGPVSGALQSEFQRHQKPLSPQAQVQVGETDRFTLAPAFTAELDQQQISSALKDQFQINNEPLLSSAK